MNRLHRLGLPALILAALGSAGLAQIKSFTLEEMVRTADNAVYGQIVHSRGFRVDSEQAGPELFYTVLTIQGHTLADGQPITLDVTYRGGFVSDTEGVYNSEAPAADDVKVGKNIVAFYRWADDLGGGVPANTLVAAHGGLYRTVDGPRGAAVLGRGEGYAVGANVRLAQLETSVRTLTANNPKQR